MYHLATVFPAVRRIRLPLTRDQLMLLMMAINEIFLGVDTYLAHAISGTIRPYEWIPIIFGPIAGALLLLAGLIALKRRPLATSLATLVFLASAAVGLLGTYFHLIRAILPFAPAAQKASLSMIVWAPPILCPLTFALIGWLGISAAWVEEPPGSGTLILPGGRRLPLPYSKTRAYFFIVGLGILATLISSVLDHARTGFVNPWLWVPTAAGIFGTVAAIALAMLDAPTRIDLMTYTATMLLLCLAGVIGAVLHINDNLSLNTVVIERFIRGAPILAPLLFANMGSLGLITLLDAGESIQ
ncbi:MAG: hypothetical protein JXB30_08610 [Anaerolineae bacterium]|nr:hypothetical protein [Anaerolineae bacterium]